MTISNMQLLDSFIKAEQTIGNAQTTIKRKRHVNSRFINWLDSKGKSSIFVVTKSDIEDWLSEMTGSCCLNSKANYLNSVNSFYEFLLDRKYINENPFKEIVEKVNRRNKRKILRPILSVQDVVKIIKGAKNPRDRAIILTFYKTGIRAGELEKINLDNINWQERRIRIPKRKGGNPGDVYFDDECERALKLWISVRISNGDNALFTNYRGERLNYDGIGSIVKETSIRSGVGKDTKDTSEAITPHVFRYAFTTHLAANRCHPKVIQMLRGDADISMLDRYTLFTPEQVRQEYLRAIPKLGI